jgi:hypothetical protein
LPSDCDLLLVIGAPNSSNSLPPRRSGRALKARRARLIQRGERDRSRHGSQTCETLGLTAGASAPEVLVREVIDLPSPNGAPVERGTVVTTTVETDGVQAAAPVANGLTGSLHEMAVYTRLERGGDVRA